MRPELAPARPWRVNGCDAPVAGLVDSGEGLLSSRVAAASGYQGAAMIELDIPGYVLEGELGRGGMGAVYRARQCSLDRPVALKVLAASLGENSEFKVRFQNEGRIIATLAHPHIVTVHDIGSRGELHYLSMELLEGGTLRERIRAGLSLADALAIARSLASALHFAHQRGVVHRDFKPMNVLFRANGSPVLTDFGIAKLLGEDAGLTGTGFTLGSSGYMSPEQAMGRPIDARADLYAFGVVFWEMLTGRPPYEAPDTFALALKHATAPLPVLPGELAPFQRLTDLLLAKQPEQRYAGLDVFLLDLKAVAPEVFSTTPEPSAATLVERRPVDLDAPTERADAAQLTALSSMEATLVRPPRDSASPSVHGMQESLVLLERELARMVARLPDHLEALRIDDVAAAGLHLRTCSSWLAACLAHTGEFLQVVTARSLSSEHFDRLVQCMDRHSRLETLATQMLEFGRTCLLPTRGPSLVVLKHNMVEGLDALLLTLADAVVGNDEDLLDMVKTLAGDRSDLMQGLRRSYLTDETRTLDANDKSVLLRLTGQFERLAWALGALLARY